ncbi:hypothetical protein H9Q70_010994 [Fusarium xylarioides]|nr:hypothetical protein H9Q70_010994 [Fusarium xylarioides]KAG5775456.1 hypothetical protein H9Q73_010872 [Fusarium xylarioides]
MHCNYFLLGFAAFAATGLALPTVRPANTGKRVPAWYEGKGGNFDDGQLVSEELEKKKDDGSWHPGKHEGKGTGHDDGSWRPGKYEGDCTGDNDGKLNPVKNN